MSHPRWGDRFAEPVVVLTADQDWAPDWAMGELVAFAHCQGFPLHVFATNASPALDEAVGAGDVTVGVHPNFLPRSSHGSDPGEVIAHCRDLVPGATTFRTHSFHEDSRLLERLRESGFVVDSNLCLFLEPGLVPYVHAAGTLRFPVFLEDDDMLRWLGAAEAMRSVPPTLHVPGLKVLNVHPALFAINAPDLVYYEERRTALYSGSEPPAALRYPGVGVASVVTEIIASVRGAGLRVESFETLAGACRARLERLAEPALARWFAALPAPVARAMT